MTSLRLLSIPALAALLLVAAWPAHAHGGRFRAPGGSVPPTTPPPSAPNPGKPATTPGTGIPSTTGGLPDVYWGTWWELNSWAHLPDRRAVHRRAAVVTGAAPAAGATSALVRARQRELIARQHIKPVLLALLDPAAGEPDTVTAAAMLALGKVDAAPATLERLLLTAEDPKATQLEREAAVLAVGLLRRTDGDLQLTGALLDGARERLLALIGDEEAPIRARCFAGFALGLLTDQPYAGAFSKDGRLVVRGLVRLLAAAHEGPDVPIALLTALAMHPSSVVPQETLDDLRRVVLGARVGRRAWTPIERAHALSVLARLDAPGWFTGTLRALNARSLPDPVQRAARLVLGVKAASLAPEERVEAAKALIRFHKNAPDALGRGLGAIAVGRLVGADLAWGGSAVIDGTRAGPFLLDGALSNPVTTRGFDVLALGLALEHVEVGPSSPRSLRQFVAKARETLQRGFERPKGDDDLRSAYAIALGMARVRDARGDLVEVVLDGNALYALRSRAALALAQMGARDTETLAALGRVLDDDRAMAPRGPAAFALTLLTGRPHAEPLITELRTAKSQRAQVQVALALARLDDPSAVAALVEFARAKRHNAEMRALAVALCGVLGDPESTPSLFRLTLDANYIARTDALQEAFTLL